MEDRLVVFLYILMRDHLPVGTIESIVQGQVECAAVSQPHDWSKGRKCSRCGVDSQDSMGSFCILTPEFSNKHLAAYAAEISQRLGVQPTITCS